VYLLVSQKETNIFGLLFVLQIKKNKYTNKKVIILYAYRVSVQRNHLFGITNTQKTVAKVRNLRTEEKPSYVYLCTCVSGQRNHSLNLITLQKRFKRKNLSVPYQEIELNEIFPMVYGLTK
jgi:hypothetical protein